MPSPICRTEPTSCTSAVTFISSICFLMTLVISSDRMAINFFPLVRAVEQRAAKRVYFPTQARVQNAVTHLHPHAADQIRGDFKLTENLAAQLLRERHLHLLFLQRGKRRRRLDQCAMKPR